MMIADFPLALLSPTACIRSPLLCTKALHLPFLAPRVIHLPHHCMVFLSSPLPFCCTARLSICSLGCLILLLLPICTLQGALFSFQQAVLGSQHTPLLSWEAQLSLMEIIAMAHVFLMGCSCEPRGWWARLQLGADRHVLCCPWRTVVCGGVVEHCRLAPDLQLQP